MRAAEVPRAGHRERVVARVSRHVARHREGWDCEAVVSKRHHFARLLRAVVLSAIRRSLARLAALSGDLTVYPGHDAPTTLELERSRNPYMPRRSEV